MQIDKLLSLMAEKGSSDLHLRVPGPPVFRVDGMLIPQEELSLLSPEDLKEAFRQITTTNQREIFYQDLELDFAYSLLGVARFRVNVMLQRGTLSIAFRRVSFELPNIDKLQLPQLCKDLVFKPRGLILITGPTGSGKSTTLAAMIEYLNEHERRNVITIEDPIEYLYTNKLCILAQRDMGDDTKSFSNALIHSLRHDPDVILVGEMRDLETISTAITAAETGHLVLATLHTVDAVQTIDRIIDAFPPEHQRQVRLQLAQVLEAILSQALLPRIEGKGRIAAIEILVATAAVRNLIRNSKTHELTSAIQLGTENGMQTLNQSLASLVKNNKVAIEEALRRSSNTEQLRRLIQN